MAQSPVAVQVPGMQVSFGRWLPKAPHTNSFPTSFPENIASCIMIGEKLTLKDRAPII